MTDFTLPESYRAYLNDAAVRSAVHHILDSKNLEVPVDLEWNRLPDFHTAVLAAHQVRCDYATALHHLWNKVWKPALDGRGSANSLEPRSFNEPQDHSVSPCDTYSAWNNSFLDRVYDSGDHVVGLGVTIGLKKVWLSNWLYKGNEDLTTRLKLGGDWNSEPEEGFLYSHEQLAPISDGGIPLCPLNRAARQALQEIGGILGVPKE